jgi:6-phosphogluconolactonase
LRYVTRRIACSRSRRIFNIDPSGQFLICAHQDSDTIVSFRITQQTGVIVPTGHELTTIAEPLCVQFAPRVGVS